MLDQAFDALKTYDWGVDPKTLQPIHDEIIKTHGDDAARKKLETRLAAVLKTDAPQSAKDAVCRMLRVIGTSASVPALAPLLLDEKLSHMARYALERIPDPEAGQILRLAVAKVPAKAKTGVISSLGVRGEDASVAPLQALISDSDPAVANAAAHALGSIGSLAAAKALIMAKPSAATKVSIPDAAMECAENLLASGNKAAAKITYEKMLAAYPDEPVKQAARLGIQACAKK